MMNIRKKIPIILLIIATFMLTGCGNRSLWGGAAAGAAATGGAYEYQNKRAMDELEEEYRAGRITRDEYERRKEEIGDRSIVY